MFEQLLSSLTKADIVIPGKLNGVFTAKAAGLPRFSEMFEAIGDNAYVFGGNTGSGVTNTMQQYNFASDTWSSVTQINTPAARYGSATAVVNGKMYIFGGYTTAASSEAYVFDPTNNTWTAIRSLPSARYYGTAVVINNKVYLFGGFSGTVPLSQTLEYDPATDLYRTLLDGSGTVGTRHAHMAGVVNGEMHIYDGVRISTILNNHYAYNPATNTWRYVGLTGFNRTYMAATSLDNKLYAFGGSQNGNTAINNFYEYDPSESGWSELPTQPTARYAAKMIIHDKKGWLFGGLPNGSSTAPLGELWQIE